MLTAVSPQGIWRRPSAVPSVGSTASHGYARGVRAIIEVLQSDARLTPERIAVMTGLDVETVRAQIAEWEREGVIRRYKAVIDSGKLRELTGTEVVTALIDVSVTPERGFGFDNVAARIARFTEVRSVCLVSGGQDLRCEVTGASMAEIADFVATKLATIDRVRSTATHFVMKTYKTDGELFLPAEEDHRLKIAP
jgi:DNA-binding Lrp family transcriptional regulator